MSAVTDDPKRRPVPRWRSFRGAIAHGSLGRTSSSSLAAEGPQSGLADLHRAAEDWRSLQNSRVAGDLLGEAMVLGQRDDAIEAAQWVLRQESAPARLRALAAHISGQEIHPAGSTPHDPSPSIDRLDRWMSIRKCRSRLRLFPLEAATWMDLARAYVVNGQDRLAMRPVEVALALHPCNRFIVRSAVRFMLHVRRPDRARDLLIKNPRTPEDPWLLAAEIAVASVQGRTPRFVKVAMSKLAERNAPAIDLSELASAVGTLELEAGSGRVAKKLFQFSLADPTENAVAQVEWAARQDSRIVVPEDAFAVIGAHEATAWSSLQNGAWGAIDEATEGWLSDEPFSSRPAIFGSWSSLITSLNFERSRHFAEAGLVTHPDNPVLLNNLAVALANLGELELATQNLDKAAQLSTDDKSRIATTASRGLIYFRRGDIASGRQLYKQAVSIARQAHEPWLEALALLHLAREEHHIDLYAAEQRSAEASVLLRQLPLPFLNLGFQFAKVAGLSLP